MLFDNILWNVFSATWCQLGLNLVPKTYPNRRQVGSQVASSKQIGKIGKMCTAPRRELDFQGFWGPKLAPKSVKNRCKKGSETGRQLGWVWDGSRHRFLTILGASWEPRWAQKVQRSGSKAVPKNVRKNVQKMGLLKLR